MLKRLVIGTAATVLIGALALPAMAQKPGGILRIYHRDSPASMSVHEEGTIGVIMPMMGVFNNLVMFDQNVPQNSDKSIVPDLATSWAWNEDDTALTFKLRDGVKWHDGKPFTAADVKCTFDLLTNQGKEKLRLNYRESWWVNLKETTVNGPSEATLHLKQPQPALLALLASGDTPIYPCHVAPAQMRQHPIGTGPFKFVEYKPNQGIKLAKNPDYWKPGRPYLDGIEYTIIPNRSTAILGFIAGKFDMTFPYEVTFPLLKDIKSQAPQAVCEEGAANESVGILMNRTKPPFDNRRRARGDGADPRPQIVHRHSRPGRGRYRRRAAAAAGRRLGNAGRTADDAARLWRRRAAEPREGARADEKGRLRPGQASHDQDVDAQHPGLSRPRGDPARSAEGDLDRRRARTGRDRELGAEADPQGFHARAQRARHRGRRAGRLFLPELCQRLEAQLPGFNDPEFDKLVDQQSQELDPEKRKKMVQDADYLLQKGLGRPIVYHLRAATCWSPQLKGVTLMSNSQYNGWRMEDWWLDK